MSFFQSIDTIGTANILYFVSLCLTPIGRYIIPLFRSRNSRLFFHLVFGLSLGFILFRLRFLYAIAFSLSGYISLSFPNPIYVSIFAWTANSLIHFYTLFILVKRKWQLEITSITIMIFQKIIMTTYNLHDFKSKNKRAFMKKFQLKDRPSLFEWLSYCFTPYSSFSGPTFEFLAFNYIIDNQEKPSESSRNKISKYLVFSFITALIHMFKEYFNYPFYETNFYLHSFLPMKLLFITCISFINGCEYFSVWNAVEAGLTQLGFYDNTIFQDISQYSIFDLFQTQSINTWLEKWNHSVYLFFRKYLFYRLLDAKLPFQFCRIAVFFGFCLWCGFRLSTFLVLPEILLALEADKLMLDAFPIQEKDSNFLIFLRILWTWVSMFNSACSWWSGTVESWLWIKKTSMFGGFFLSLTVYIVSFLVTKLRVPQKKKTK